MNSILRKIFFVGVRDSRLVREPTPAATEYSIVAFEKLIGAELPADYREFLATINGGMFDDDQIDCIDFDIHPLVCEKCALAGSMGLLTMFSLYEGDSELMGGYVESTLKKAYGNFANMKEDYPYWPPDCVPIGDVMGDGYILLAVAGPHKNKVLFYGYCKDPEELYGNVSLAGKNFSEFVESWDVSYC